MSRQKTYKDILDYLESENYSNSLISNEKEFEEEKLKQNKSGSYVKLRYECPNCREEFKRDLMGVRKNEHFLCNGCMKIKRGKKNRISEDKIVSVCNEVGVVVESISYDGEYHRVDGKCKCGEKIHNTIYQSIKNANKNSDKTFKCKKCEAKNLRERFKLSLQEIEEELSKKGCSLISPYEDYNNNDSRLKIKMSCGHEYETTLLAFRNGSGVCLKCSHKANSGENTYNWNGGYDSKKVKFRKTYEFKEFVKQVLKRDEYSCRICNCKDSKLNVHHLEGYNWCEEKRTEVDNGIALCKQCHENFHDIYGRGNNTKKQFEEYLKERA